MAIEQFERDKRVKEIARQGNRAPRPVRQSRRKPKGARHKTTLLAERLMQDDVEKIVNAVLTAARNGDMMAAKIILDRVAPVRSSHSFDLPKIECPDDEVAARAAVLEAVADGALTWRSRGNLSIDRGVSEKAQKGGMGSWEVRDDA